MLSKKWFLIATKQAVERDKARLVQTAFGIPSACIQKAVADSKLRDLEVVKATSANMSGTTAR
jgi:hypothetical protein